MSRLTKPTRLLVVLITIAVMGLLAACRAQAKSQGIREDPMSRASDPGLALGRDIGVAWSTAVDQGSVLRGEDGLVHLQVTLRTEATEGRAVRAPTDLVIVLDRSGSMEGAKLAYAKEALRELIGRLRADDRLGIVAYSSEAELLSPLRYATEAARRDFLTLANSIREGGNTNLSDGLDLGQRLLERNRKPNRPARLLLLSDGLANSGDSSLSGLVRRARRAISQEYVLSTMGIGSDFDERLMTELATAGAGAFYYLARLETLPSFFDAELNAAGSTVASGTTLRFTASSGVVLLDAMGLGVTRRGNVSEVAVGSLYDDHERSIWLTLRVPTSALGHRPLGQLSLEYRGASGRLRSEQRELPRVDCVEQWDDYARQVNRELWERAVLEEELTRSRERLGDAIAVGTASDVDEEVKRVSRHQKLASALGSTRVEQALSEFAGSAVSAKQAQSAPAAARNSAAKRQKSSGYMERNKSQYYRTDPMKGF